MGEVEAVEVEEAILASREVTCQPGAILRWCSRSRERRNASEVKDDTRILPLMEAEELFNREDQVELMRLPWFRSSGKIAQCVDRV